MELHSCSWNRMQAYVTVCKLMKLQNHITACKVMALLPQPWGTLGHPWYTLVTMELEELPLVHGQPDGQTDIRTCRAASSQLKNHHFS